MSMDNQQRKNVRTGGILLVIGILLIASNLRAPFTAVGSLVPVIRDSLGVSNTVIGTITTLPLLAFALVSPISPKIANRFGMEKTILGSMLILLVGIILRSVTGVSTLFIGTALIGIAIAFGNVLLPGLIKLSFPLRVGLLTGLYGVCMNIFAAIASGVSVPLSNIKNLGWQGALVVWGMITILSIVCCLPLVKRSADLPDYDVDSENKKLNLWKSFTAWQVTLFMGIQSLLFYTMLTWLPEILLGHGYTANEAGWMLSLMQFAIIPMTFIVPIIASKMKNQVILSAMTATSYILGVLGLLHGHPISVVIAVILWGIACGSAFSLSMMFFTLRTKDGYAASELSGMAQSIGYLLAAIGPVLFGGLFDLFHSWTVPLFTMLADLGWIDTYRGLIIPAIGWPFGIFLMKQFSQTIPTELLEAAEMDGSGELRTFYHIVLPMLKPALGALAIFTFILSWNDYFSQLVITRSTSMMTLPLGIATMQGEFKTDYGVMMAGAALASIPMIVIFSLFQKSFTQGITMGSIK